MAAEAPEDVPFPWHLAVFDAHCHPTDTVSSIETIRNMKARALTVMATRAEDQELVTTAAQKYGVNSADPTQWPKEQCIVPCFGWHPWFAHQMYIDDESESTNGDSRASSSLTGDAKVAHYQKVLQPARPDPLSTEDRDIFLSLPDPTSFSDFIASTKEYLSQHPYALVGEIGLDRSFRIPESWNNNQDLWSKRDKSLTPGGREGRRLTPFRCGPQHQKAIFKKQLQLAAEMSRAVSVHGVQAHGLVFESLSEMWKGHEKTVLSKREKKKQGVDHPSVNIEDEADQQSEKSKVKTSPPYPPRICLHSYSGNASNFKQYLNPAIPAHIFASFSTAINLSDALDEETPAAFVELVKSVPDHMLLVESDLHTAGDEMDRRLEDIVRRICVIKGWSLDEGVRKLGQNWRTFVFGGGE